MCHKVWINASYYLNLCLDEQGNPRIKGLPMPGIELGALSCQLPALAIWPKCSILTAYKPHQSLNFYCINEWCLLNLSLCYVECLLQIFMMPAASYFDWTINMQLVRNKCHSLIQHSFFNCLCKTFAQSTVKVNLFCRANDLDYQSWCDLGVLLAANWTEWQMQTLSTTRNSIIRVWSQDWANLWPSGWLTHQITLLWGKSLTP